MLNLRPSNRGNVPHIKEQDAIPPPPFFHSAEDLSTTSSYGINIASVLAGPEVIIILPIIVAVLVVCSLRECYLAHRRDVFRSTLAERLAATQEHRRVEAQKARSKVIESALIVKTASKCNCNLTFSSWEFRSGSTMQSNITDDTSITSSSYDSGNLSPIDCDDDVDHDDDDQTLSLQTCAICLEPYAADKDQVSWSRFQTCHHAFHHKCIEAWLAETKRWEGSCPCCRGPYLRRDTAGDRGEGGEENNEEEEEMNSTDRVSRDNSASASSPDDESHLLGAVAEDSVTTGTGAKFTSFCVVHGLISEKERYTLEKKHQYNRSVSLDDQQIALEEPLLRSWREER